MRLLTAKEQSLLEAIEKKAEGTGVEIVTIEVVGAKKAPTIRVYIDTPEGVSFDQLSGAQSWIGDLMDSIDPFPGAYTLEVSSPGIDRPLRTPEHFARYVGETAAIKTQALDGRSNWTGQIVSADDEGVVLQVEDAQHTIPYSAMKRAHLKGTINFG